MYILILHDVGPSARHLDGPLSQIELAVSVK